jgi:DNA replication and repair protein RecF
VAPLMLLDDVMSELDAERRSELVALLRAGTGQAVITATDLAHIPGAQDEDVWRLSVRTGEVAQADVGDPVALGGGVIER